MSRDLLPNDVDSVPKAPFLVLLFDLEYMVFQIPNILLRFDPFRLGKVFMLNAGLGRALESICAIVSLTRRQASQCPFDIWTLLNEEVIVDKAEFAVAG